jgi:hypothetical protein
MDSRMCLFSIPKDNRTARVTIGIGGAEPNGDSIVTDMTSDGRWLVVESCATNLVVGDENGKCDLFAVDRFSSTPTFELINVDSAGAQANGDYAPNFVGGTRWGSISSDGSLVAFASSATNLIAGDTNSHADIFLRDRLRRTTTLLSRSQTGGFSNGNSRQPRISADGVWVTFDSSASNLGGSAGLVWVVGTATLEKHIVSVASNGLPKSGVRASISSDGRYVAFTSLQPFFDDDTDGRLDVLVRDRLMGRTYLASKNPDGTPILFETFGGSISAQGLTVPFTVDEGDSFGGASYAFDVGTGRVEKLISAPAGVSDGLRPYASSDGEHVVIAHNGKLIPGDTNGSITDVYRVRGLQKPDGLYSQGFE